MKLISLNTWGGRAGNKILLDFFRKHNEDIDIFCLQEMWEGGHEHAPKWGENIDTNLITNVNNILKNYSVFFRPHYHDFYGLAIYIKKSINIEEEGDIFVFKERENIFDDFNANHARNLQYITIDTENGIRTIVNFHGLWNGVSKEDTAERFIQADNIIKFLKNTPNLHILCGDFNLMPENKSLKMIEDLGMKNLIKEFDISSTRSSYYKKPCKFADYVLINKDIKINEFKVLPDEVSDHLAMYLDFK